LSGEGGPRKKSEKGRERFRVLTMIIPPDAKDRRIEERPSGTVEVKLHRGGVRAQAA